MGVRVTGDDEASVTPMALETAAFPIRFRKVGCIDSRTFITSNLLNNSRPELGVQLTGASVEGGSLGPPATGAYCGRTENLARFATGGMRSKFAPQFDGPLVSG